jgi:hypothetical protein
MRRRLPFEPEHLVQALTSWIEWRYAQSRRRLVLTSAPITLPPDLESWMPNAVWRLAWQGNGAAVLYGLAPRDIPGKFCVIRHDASASQEEGFFELLADGTWHLLDGDSLAPVPVSRDYRARGSASSAQASGFGYRRPAASRLRARLEKSR